jgi:D-serine deaminase-like pyridoxal phosphate-dependent protein
MREITKDLTASVKELPTPALLLDVERVRRNVTRLRSHLSRLGVPLRPHLKTAKCAEVARMVMNTAAGPATVSTLREAEQFAAAGVRDLLYAVGIGPDKLPRILALRKSGIDLCIILDSLEQALAVVAACKESKTRIPILIEIDADRSTGRS